MSLIGNTSIKDVDGLTTIKIGSKLFFQNTTNQQKIQGIDNELSFFTSAIERINIDTSGKIGIGTNSQTELLHLSGASPNIIIENTAETTSGIIFQDSSAPETQAFHFDWSASTTDMELRSDTNTCLYLRENGNVSVGSNTLPIKVLQVNSTTSGMLPPRMTTTQRDAISAEQPGELVYNTTTNKLQCWNGTIWNDCF